jgi:flagellar FliJ protein
MTSLQPLAILLEQNERERDQALAAQQRAQAASDAAAAQSEQLVAYRRDYEQRWNEQFRRQGHIEVVRSYHSFMERLTQAVEQQVRAAGHAKQMLDKAVLGVRDAELRVASVRKLIERRTQEMRVAAERRDQKVTDEAASRVAWNNRPRAAGLGRHRIA